MNSETITQNKFKPGDLFKYQDKDGVLVGKITGVGGIIFFETIIKTGDWGNKNHKTFQNGCLVYKKSTLILEDDIDQIKAGLV